MPHARNQQLYMFYFILIFYPPAYYFENLREENDTVYKGRQKYLYKNNDGHMYNMWIF